MRCKPTATSALALHTESHCMAKPDSTYTTLFATILSTVASDLAWSHNALQPCIAMVSLPCPANHAVKNAASYSLSQESLPCSSQVYTVQLLLQFLLVDCFLPCVQNKQACVLVQYSATLHDLLLITICAITAWQMCDSWWCTSVHDIPIRACLVCHLAIFTCSCRCL